MHAVRVTFLLFSKVSSHRQHEVQAASLRDGGVLLFVCMSVCGGGCLSCRSLFVFVVIYCCRRLGLVHETTMTSIFGGYVSLFTGNVGQLLWLLSTVHSQQQQCTPDSQECTPERQECTVDSEASEAQQTFPVNNVSQFRLSLDENTLDMQPISFHQSASVSTHTMLVNV